MYISIHSENKPFNVGLILIARFFTRAFTTVFCFLTPPPHIELQKLNNLNSHYYTSDCSVYVNGLPVKHICGGNDLGGESMVVGQSKSDGIGETRDLTVRRGCANVF